MRKIPGICIVALAVVLMGAFSAPAWAGKFAGNSPYVAAVDQFGVFYAKSVPDEIDGDKGVTRVMRVQKEADELLTTYPWYAERGLALGWSPTAGKVALVRLHQQIGKPVEEQIELSFYLGEKFLKSYTTADLVKMGIKTWYSVGESGRKGPSGGDRASYTSLGCKQVWNTNDRYFAIKISESEELKFDILTGKRCKVEIDNEKHQERMVLME